MSDELIPREHVERVCRPGAGEKTCRFLASKSLPDYYCAKSDPGMLIVIAARMGQGTMGAKGDNCGGPPDYAVP